VPSIGPEATQSGACIARTPSAILTGDEEGAMLVRIFEGEAWAAARPLGDFSFESVPIIGHKLVVVADAGWATGIVIDVAHRVTDPGEAADMALLVAPMTTSADQSDLPLADLDRLARPGTPPSPVPAPMRPSPWR
jgi:hypothetical protein